MGALSIWHWVVVLLVILMLFGAGKFSSLMGDFGKGLQLFKRNIEDAS
jgi:sec-independent protein translocase protein TatA